MFWDDKGIERPDPQGREAEIRWQFVQEYMFDRNPIQAATRMGLTGKFAISWAETFMQEPYVLRMIKEQEVVFAERFANKDPAIMSRIVNSLFTESQTAVKCSTRVAALSKLANMAGLDEEGDTGDGAGTIVISVTGRKEVVKIEESE